MKEQTYYFQQKTAGLEWEETPARTLTFDKESEMVKFAQNLALFLQLEIRVTDNKDLVSGRFFHYLNT